MVPRGPEHSGPQSERISEQGDCGVAWSHRLHWAPAEGHREGGPGEKSMEVLASSVHNSSLMPSTQGVSMACFTKDFPYIFL